ncbi:MAG: hypothetical protein P8M04_12520, partial [Akkermansiaceae bacterium]|nr:hypothetical protein [Akkermansiaceae bacterium]
LESFADTRAMLIRELETFRHGGEALFESLDRLSAAKRTTSQDRARINWVKEIVPLAAIMAEKVGAKEKIADELMDPALRAADSLVRALPYEGSIAVAKGWMFFRAGDSGVFATFVNPRREEKAAPVLRALAGLSAAKTRDVLGQQFPDSKNRKLAEYLLSEAELRALVIKIPAAFNDLSAPDVPLFDKTLTPEVAKAMAPHLARNPHAEAAMVRAWAKAEHKYSAVTDDMMKSEMWRFTEIKALTHGLWHSGMFERDVEHDVPIKKYEKLDAQFQTLKKQTSKEASSKDRLAAFKVLQGDLLGASPRIVGSLPLWSELFTNAPDPDKVTMLKSMTSNLQGGREFLLRRILPNCRFGKSGSIFWQAEVYDNHFRYHQKDTRENGAELLTHLTRTVESQAKAGTLSETVFGMWLHGIDVRDEKMQEVMKAIAKSPAYAKLDPAYHRAAADQHHFGEIALTPTLAAADPRYLSRELLALPKEAAPAQVEAALKAVVERSSKAPSTTAVVGLSQVAALPEWSAATRSLVLSLFKENAPIGDYPDRQGYEPLVIRIAKDTTESKKWNALEPYAAGLWQAAASPDHPRSQGASVLSSLAELMLKEDSPSLASTFCRVALRGPVGRVLFKKQDSEIPKIAARVNGVSGPAALAIGAVEIPVDETDPAYPIYKSNAEFVQGNLDSAWDLYLKNADQLQPILRELSVDYGFWLLDRNTRMGRTGEGEALVKELTIWSRQAEGTFSLEQEAELKIAYADLAFLKGALPTSRAYYRRVADAKEYQGSEMGLRAALGSVKVDRASKNFGAAMTELDKLLRVKNVSFRNKVRYARAEVFMDQENYKEGLDEIEAVLLREPKHPDALILRGKIHNEMRKLVEASEIELGPSQENTVIVPGEAVKINLRDPTLRVSGVGADIEVEIWAKSGDRERVMLYQLGDNKEKFRAEVPTSLGPPVPGDKTLQILGEDEIRFGYSKRFRAKMDDLPDDPTVVISVASDASLDLTAGAFPPREGERRLAIEELGLSTAQAALGTRSVRPGNPVYLRLTDSDQSKTPGVDEVFVTLVTSSGDEIRRLALAETGPFTGEFQAIVPTSGAQALAFASESAPGRDPNMAISAEDYPGWMGKVGDKDEVRIFGVDLNDNVSVDKMSVTTGGVGESLTHFVLQTSMNGKDWTTRSRFPEAKNPAPWDGHPRISYSLRTNPARNSIYPLPKDRQLPDDWKQAMEVSSLRPKTSYDAEIVPNLTLGKLSQIGGFHPNEKVLFKFRALFYQPASAVRRFRLEGFPVAAEDNETGMVFFIDGLPAVGESEDPLAIERELGPGLHEIQIWSTESLGGIKERKPVLFCDESGKDDLVPCPDAMFDPNNFPEGVHQKIDQQATISKTEKGFDFSFGDQTQARLVRLVIAGFEGVAPVIGKLTLSDRDGTTLLPVRQDFQSLRENTELEVLPGDQITARYEDPVTATPRRTRHEKRLTVAYNNAEITASFLNYETTEEGRVLILEPIRRFRFDDAVAIVIDDPDMDGSPEKDVIELLVTTASGGKATIKALETEEHSGRFLGRVFPVEGEPGRASEIQMSKGGSLTATYRDEENLDPGIPTDRSVTISHAVYQDPSISAYTIASKPLEVPVAEETNAVNTPGKRLAPEIVMPRRRLDYSHVESADSAKEPLQGVVGASLRFDVVVPHLALAGSSEIRAYVQTEAGRKSAEGTLKSPFDVGVPGTMKLTGVLEGVELAEPSGYEVGESPRPPSNEPPLEEGRFSFSVPLVLGDQPTRSFANKAAESLPRTSIPEGLIVKSGDIVHLGYPYKDVDDSVKWKTTSFRVGSHGFLDVMDGNYNSA